ncbi:MAG: restriction endonuclease subunit S [Methanobrevibacter sp.]|jgi:type I restriction enzyme S subunit|nr:restriction endonuclease subunit S [Candidatus Methanovirga meridionalis]
MENFKEGWEKVKLDEIINITMGQSPKSEFYNDESEGLPFLQGNRTFGDRFPYFNTFCTNNKKIAKKDDVLMSVRAPVGDLNIVKQDIGIGRGLCAMNLKNKNSIFLYYLLKYNIVNLINRETGTIFGSINKNDILNLEIELPTCYQQEKIAFILNNLDEKIENNEKINKNLEQQVNEIFKSWFVKFEPFKENEFKSSDFGEIPVEWEIDYLGSNKLSKIISSGIQEFKGSKFYVATANVNEDKIDNVLPIISYNNRPSRANMQPVPKSAWFAKMKDSRKLIMIDEYSKSILDKYIFSTGFCGLKCSKDSFYYIWSFLLSDQFDTMKNNLSLGTTMQAINNTNVKKIKLLNPTNEVLKRFNLIVSPIFEEIYNNSIENKKLTKTRDILLPKLMSGEINVSKVEI